MPLILIAVPSKKEKPPLSVTHPELAKEADGWDPREYTFGSGLKKNWLCRDGHKFEASISNRARLGSGCPFCSGRKVLPGFNDLATLHPEIAREAYGWDTSQVAGATHQKKLWECPVGHIYESSVAHRTSKEKRGCSVCAGKVIIVGANDLESNFPEVAKQADGWDPKTITPGSDKRMPWICALGHKYNASVGSRTNLETGCPVCDNKRVLKGFNDLASKYPDIASQAVDWDPSEYAASAHKKMKWECPIGHQYLATIAHRTSAKKTGCPTCGSYGFDQRKEGFLYLISHSGLLMQQLGITNNVERRMSEHKKRGWELIEYRGPMEGHLTQQWETAILQMLKAKGADLSNSRIAGKFDGYSEAWSKSTFEVSSIKELMRMTEEFEESKLGD